MNTILLLLLPLALALPAQDPLVQLESNQDFVIGSSCTIEAFDDQENLDEGKLEECGDCFENADTEEKAKTCTIEHLPYFYDECRIWIESPTAPLEEVLHASSVEEALLVHQEAALAFVVAFLQVVRHELEEELPVEGLEELLLSVVDRPRT